MNETNVEKMLLFGENNVSYVSGRTLKELTAEKDVFLASSSIKSSLLFFFVVFSLAQSW